jgi:hypothetical protein
MTLLRLAGSMLLALALAALSALSATPGAPPVSLSAQALAAHDAATATRLDARLASIDARAPRPAPANAGVPTPRPIIPTAGEFIPGAGQ